MKTLLVETNRHAAHFLSQPPVEHDHQPDLIPEH